MVEFATPHVVLSKCIEFEECRYDGRIISSEFVRKLKAHVNFIPVCPEIEIGLGIPRKPLRLVQVRGKPRLLQSDTNLDLTEKMQNFAISFLHSLSEIDGFILKGKSPTSAFRNARVYSGTNPGAAIISKGPGLFGSEVLHKFPCLAIEDEGRLRNPRIKEHFLTKLFTLASFRNTIESGSHKDLQVFHTRNKLLYKAYNQKEAKILGNIIAKRQRYINQKTSDYQQHLCDVLKRPPRCGSNINVMMHAMGYFSNKLSTEEKHFFLESLQKYKDGVIPLSVSTHILQLWLNKYREDYLLNQTFFQPYPIELMDIETMTAYCNGKDFWQESIEH